MPVGALLSMATFAYKGKKPYGPQSLKYLPSDPLQKRFAIYH